MNPSYLTTFTGPHRIAALLVALQRLLAQQYTQRLRPLGLTPPQVELLDLLRQYGTIPAGNLAELYHVRPPVITAAIDSLVERGLVTRLDDPQDRRKVLLSATEAGQRMMARAEEHRTQMIQRMLAGFAEQEQRRLHADLIRILTNLEGQEPEPPHAGATRPDETQEDDYGEPARPGD